MSRDEVWEKLVELCREVFENDDLVLSEASSAEDVEEWDSLTHLNLISDIEEEFDITFTLEEISCSKNLGELLEAICRHRS